MNTQTAKRLAKKMGCSLAFIHEPGGPGMWFLTVSTENKAWRSARENDPVYSSGELARMTAEQLTKECQEILA